MLRYSLRRVPSALAILLVASVVVFTLLRLIPGDPATFLAGPDASPAAIHALREQLGLNGSQIAQYFTWIGGLLTFDLGRSVVLGGEIGTLIGEAGVTTVVLALTALVLAVLIAFSLSTAAVIFDKKWLTTLVTGFSALAVAIPNFVTGVVLVMLFGVLWVVLPAGGVPSAGLAAQPDVTTQYLLLPALVLALPSAAALTRFLTESLRSQLALPYVTTARALGIGHRRIVFTQVLRNALPPAVTVLGLQVGQLLGGAVIVEAIFAWPGLGHLLERAISTRDYPVVQILLLLSVVVFVVVQLLSDVAHASLDPRVRLDGAR